MIKEEAGYGQINEVLLKDDELSNEASMLGVGGMPLKIVWINQTNLIRIMTPVDDVDFFIYYRS